MASENPSKALQLATPLAAPNTAPLPPMVLSKTLAAAPARSFLHVDRHGRVRSPTRYRLLQGASYGLLGGTLVAAISLYGSILGIPGFALGAVLAAWAGYRVGQGRMVQHATQLLVHDRHDEAEPIFLQLASGWGVPAGVKALAKQNLGALCMRQGRFVEALEHQEAALRIYGRKSKQLFARTTAYAQVLTLVNLNRATDARALLLELGPEPEGEYLKLLYWTSTLYVAMAQGRHGLDEDRVHAVSRFSLSITGAAALLGLSAWAWSQLNDVEQAWLLLREAYERREGHHLPQAMPLLHQWMEANANAAGIPSHQRERDVTP